MKKFLHRRIDAYHTNDHACIGRIMNHCEGMTIPKDLENMVGDVLRTVQANMPANKVGTVTGDKQAACYVVAAVLWWQENATPRHATVDKLPHTVVGGALRSCEKILEKG